MAILELTSDSPLLPQVLDLARRNRSTLGFLPDQGFKDRADKGTLLVDVDDDAGVRGYAP